MTFMVVKLAAKSDDMKSVRCSLQGIETALCAVTFMVVKLAAKSDDMKSVRCSIIYT